jgi:hypothetical protein
MPWIDATVTTTAETVSLFSMMGADSPPAALKWLTQPVITVQIKQRESGAWVTRTAVPKVRVGGAWVVKRPKRWNGSAWVNLL